MWGSDLRWVYRCQTLGHHLAVLDLFVAINLLEEAGELLCYVHRLRLGHKLVDLKRLSCGGLDAVRRRYFRVRGLLLTR